MGASPSPPHVHSLLAAVAGQDCSASGDPAVMRPGPGPQAVGQELHESVAGLVVVHVAPGSVPGGLPGCPSCVDGAL